MPTLRSNLNQLSGGLLKVFETISYVVVSGNLDTSKHTKTLVMRSVFVVNHLMLRQEKTQVNGFILLVDLTGFSLKHQTFWTVDEIRHLMNAVQVWSANALIICTTVMSCFNHQSVSFHHHLYSCLHCHYRNQLCLNFRNCHHQ